MGERPIYSVTYQQRNNVEYKVTITSTWIVDAESKEEAIENFTDGLMTSLEENAELVEVE